MERTTFISLFKQGLEELLERYRSKDESVSDHDFFVNHRVTDLEEEELLNREICDYVEAFYRKRREYEDSSLAPDEWFAQQVDNTIVELFPDATEAEKDDFRQAVVDGIDRQSSDTAEALRLTMEEVAEQSKREEVSDEK